MAHKDDWTHAFPLLRQLPHDLFVQLRDTSLIVELPEGSRIFGPGQAPESFLLLLDGTIRVQQTSESGREIVLYRVQAGESCALTTACLMGYEEYQAEGIAETRIRAVAIPRTMFDTLIASSREFRQFVFTAFSRRVTNLFRIIEEVAFQRIDVRLAQKLLELAGPKQHIAATHQDLANELGSAREVISRQLNEFARRGWLRVTRGAVEITDGPALSQLAQHG
ncbi:Crp/Fnr family transcriptional regulator [Bradyrhizobium ontarionense]|uniref:Crp/Fnr family transcriptional regulator n=1 Tax=Bradyrhizobium ontarionense TaxID=2898149 RepID=A0ABY3R9M2_9BRAD|nr:Crp/Fnr family transcriptional regulator [Bradyrhizobium sp. A19]UFZ03737.1 Crp/Fnr family transcriptional regulator [Bradyrhizobium sp. A19]